MNVRMRSKCRSEPSLEKISFQNQNKAGAMIPLITLLFSGIEVGRDEVTHTLQLNFGVGFIFAKQETIYFDFSVLLLQKSSPLATDPVCWLCLGQM